jgi:hypothetical protein
MIKHSELVFGIPTMRSKQEEKYPDLAVITMLADAGKGTSKKLDLNTNLVETLELKLDGNDMVNFAFTMEEEQRAIYFAVTTHIDNPGNLRVTKQATVSNKRMYEYLAKVFELDTTVDNELLISDISAGVGRVVVVPSVIANNVVAEDTTQEQESALASADLAVELEEPQADIQAEVASIVQETEYIEIEEDN